MIALTIATLVLAADDAVAEPRDTLPSPLDAIAVARLARERRAEVQAARFRVAAAAERPKIVSVLPDPMLMVSADHIPFSPPGVNGSVSVQQEFPLSGVLGARRRAAEADLAGTQAQARTTQLDVTLEAVSAFYSLAERRLRRPILDEQIAIVEQLAVFARAHLVSGQGTQADVLRLDNERARLLVERSALDAETRAAEAILDAALARDVEAAVPELAWPADELTSPPGTDVLVRGAIAKRPELASVRAERARAVAEIDVAQAMYKPNAFVRMGPSYSMIEGGGAMAMVGVSVPIWREKLAAGVAEARATSASASADLSSLERVVAGRVAAAREQVVAEQTRLSALRSDIVPRAQIVISSATASFGAGQGPMVAVLEAARDLRAVRLEELTTRARLGQARAILDRETGE